MYFECMEEFVKIDWGGRRHFYILYPASLEHYYGPNIADFSWNTASIAIIMTWGERDSYQLCCRLIALVNFVI